MKITVSENKHELEKQAYEMVSKYLLNKDNIVIMPDGHVGKGSMVGFTYIGDKSENHPQIIGGDIGCGVFCKSFTLVNSSEEINLQNLDEFVKKAINTKGRINSCYEINELRFCNNKQKINEYIQECATLGGGNHFIELAQSKDNPNEYHLLVHTGSRLLGKDIEHYYSSLLKEDDTEQNRANYANDMNIAVKYAKINREMIAESIVEFINCNTKVQITDKFHTIHNFMENINGELIIRKGAIPAYKNTISVIPLNMSYGSLIVETIVDNKDWNYSLPHGAGRLISRSKIKEINRELNNDDLSVLMMNENCKEVYSSTAKDALSELSNAYKDPKEIIGCLDGRVKIIKWLIPIYNCKN